MQRPDVIITQPQVIQTEIKDVVGYEAELLMAKYGFIYNPNITSHIIDNSVLDNRSFEMMIKDHEDRLKQEMLNRNKFKSPTINDPNYQEVKYRDMDIDGNNIGLKIQISTDMGGIYR